MDKNKDFEKAGQEGFCVFDMDEVAEILYELEDERREFMCKPCKRRNAIRFASAIAVIGAITAAAFLLIHKNKEA